MPLRGVSTNSSAVYDFLVTAIGNVYRDVMTRGFINPVTHPGEYALFHNPHHVVDGPCYVFLVHGKGPAIGGQGFELSSNSTTTSSNVKISNNNIEQSELHACCFGISARTHVFSNHIVSFLITNCYMKLSVGQTRSLLP